MKIREIVAPLEEFAPLALQEHYDNAGLIVGDPDNEADAALVCVDVTEAVLEEAVERGAGLVIAHHPLVFHPLKRLSRTTYIERAVRRTVREGIAVYACHTNLDSAPQGMSYALGRQLGLQEMELLTPSGAAAGAGFGVVGRPECEMPTEAFLRMVRERLGTGAIRHSALVRETVRRVALCTGAGASMMADARRSGADLYLSADFRYNDFLDADNDLVIADVGHFESEYCAIGLICEIIRKKITNFALHRSERSVNPVNYLV